MIKKLIPVLLASLFVLLALVLGFALRTKAFESSPTQQEINKISIFPVADSFVKESKPENNYGLNNTLYVDNLPVTRSYLRFDVVGLDNQEEKTIKLLIYANSSNGTGFTVSTVLDNNWVEDRLTYNNAPEIGPEIGISSPIKRGRWLEVDVSNAIQTDGIYTLAITTSSSRNTNLSSRESGNKSPQLVISSVMTSTNLGDTPPETSLLDLISEIPPIELLPSDTAIPEIPIPIDNTPTPFVTTAELPTFTPSSTPAPLVSPTAVPTSSDDPVLVGAGDISTCSNDGDEATAKLIDGIAGTVFTAGDNAYESGSASEYTNCYNPTWGRFKARTNPSPGNHEYNTSGAAGYYGYFGSAAGDPTKGYYSYNLGTWHIVVLNSEISTATGSAQEKWLRQDLIANPTTCTLAYWHKPRFSSGSSHGSTSGMQPLWQALFDYHADVIVNGHEHNYERFDPQSPTGAANVSGIREFVAGMGGRSHYGFGTILPNSVARNSDTYGVLKFTLHSNSYTWQFVPEAGKTYADTGTANCIP